MLAGRNGARAEFTAIGNKSTRPISVWNTDIHGDIPATRSCFWRSQRRALYSLLGKARCREADSGVPNTTALTRRRAEPGMREMVSAHAP